MKSKLVVYLSAVVFAINLLIPRQALAVDVPNFPACANPTGEVKSSYPSGNFGIVGKEGSFSGSDSVYILSPETLTQCFCANDGSGIQTNFWKTSSLSDQQINELIADGWIFIPDGSVWGLDPASYLAKNADFSCTSNNGGGSQGGSSSNSSSNSSNGGSVLGAVASAGQVLGLASTGNLQAIAILSLIGIFLIGSGTLILRKK